MTRRDFLAAVAALPALAAEAQPLGIVIHSYGVRARLSRGDAVPFAQPLAFLDHCHALGAAGVQVGLGVPEKAAADRIRRKLDATGMYLEGIVRLPFAKADADRLDRELAAAKGLGVGVVRTVCMDGRRYETFATAEAYREFVKKSRAALELAEPIAARHGVTLAVENHKDWRVGEFVPLLEKLASRHVGVCVDTGNSIALLEDPHAVVEAYAAWARTTHFKDMAVAEYDDGFLLAEVPLGTGFLDLKKMVAVLRKHQPKVRLNLEMITRDPLRVPCLTPKYWASLDGVAGKELAEALARVRKAAAKKPLARIAGLKPEEQSRIEEGNVRTCLAFAGKNLGR